MEKSSRSGEPPSPKNVNSADPSSSENAPFPLGVVFPSRKIVVISPVLMFPRNSPKLSADPLGVLDNVASNTKSPESVSEVTVSKMMDENSLPSANVSPSETIAVSTPSVSPRTRLSLNPPTEAPNKTWSSLLIETKLEMKSRLVVPPEAVMTVSSSFARKLKPSGPSTKMAWSPVAKTDPVGEPKFPIKATLPESFKSIAALEKKLRNSLKPSGVTDPSRAMVLDPAAVPSLINKPESLPETAPPSRDESRNRTCPASLMTRVPIRSKVAGSPSGFGEPGKIASPSVARLTIPSPSNRNSPSRPIEPSSRTKEPLKVICPKSLVAISSLMKLKVSPSAVVTPSRTISVVLPSASVAKIATSPGRSNPSPLSENVLTNAIPASDACSPKKLESKKTEPSGPVKPSWIAIESISKTNSPVLSAGPLCKPANRESFPAPPLMTSSPAPPSMKSANRLPVMTSLPPPPEMLMPTLVRTSDKSIRSAPPSPATSIC